MVYLPGLWYSVEDALSRQPGEADQPADSNIGDYHSRLPALQDPVIFSAVDDWLKAVAPHLVLTGYIEAMKTALSSGHPVVALACKKCRKQQLDH